MLCSASSRPDQAAGDDAEGGTTIPASFRLCGLLWYQELLEEFDICLPITKLQFDTVKNKLFCKLWGFIIPLLVYKTEFFGMFLS